MLTHEQLRRHVSIDFTVPEAQREGLRISAEEFVVPLALLAKRPLVHFDLRNEEQHAISLLTADQHRTIARELLYRQLDSDLADQEVGDDAVVLAAGELIEAVLADEPQDVEPQIDAARRRRTGSSWSTSGRPPRCCRATSSCGRSCAASTVGACSSSPSTSPFGRGAGFVFLTGASGCTEALSYHVEVAVPADLRARRTLLVDAATGRRLVAGERDTDRPALSYRAGSPPPQAPEIVIDFAVERAPFLAAGGVRRVDHRAC